MALFALTGEVLTLNSVDYSDHLKKAELAIEVASLDTTDFASGGWEEAIGGLKKFTLSLEWMDDIADNDVDEELFALIGTVVTFAMKPTTAGISAANPEYQGSVLINGWNIGGSVGDLAKKVLTFPGTGSITRDIVA